ncbi:RNA 2',3'-cyclic phosphodiesterase [Cereibacter sp. SYSU M97828]|nr:RNA 2',3'-cyclic phosphodiesterase [Cereibacter flavus]
MRCFIALTLPDDIRSALTVQQFLLPLPRKVEPEDFHITLAFLGDADPARLEELHDALERLRLPAPELRLDGLGLFGGGKPRSVHALIARTPALEHLQAKVEQAARMAGFALEHRRFIPHVTLGRFPPPAAELAMRIERLVAATPLASRIFTAPDVVLFQSRPSGYEALARYPLD